MNQQLSEMQHEKSNVEETLVRSESTSAAELSELRSTCEKAEENKQVSYIKQNVPTI